MDVTSYVISCPFVHEKSCTWSRHRLKMKKAERPRHELAYRGVLPFISFVWKKSQRNNKSERNILKKTARYQLKKMRVIFNPIIDLRKASLYVSVKNKI